MNWRKGLIRAWIISSVAWVLLVSAHAAHACWIGPSVDARSFDPNADWEVVSVAELSFEMKVRLGLLNLIEHRLGAGGPSIALIVFLGVAVPGAVFAGGAGAVWVIQGFRHPTAA